MKYTMKPNTGEAKYYDTQQEAERGARGLLNLGRIQSAKILHGSSVVLHMTKSGSHVPEASSAKPAKNGKPKGEKPKKPPKGAKPKGEKPKKPGKPAKTGGQKKSVTSGELFKHIRKMGELGYDNAQISRNLHKQLGKDFVVTDGGKK